MSIPEPLTPHDCDLRGMPFMPLDVVRLVDSDLAAISTGDEFKAAVMLWCKAWLQVPAASLPDDDRILAHLSGAGRAWGKLRPAALRGWVKCSDGRLYHPVVAEKAREAWERREEFRDKHDAQRERKRREREDRKRLFAELRDAGHVMPWDTPTNKLRDLSRDLSRQPVTPDTDQTRLGQGEGQGQGQGQKKDISFATQTHPGKPGANGRKPRPKLTADFIEFWRLYPRKIGKGQAEKAWLAALNATDNDAEPIILGLKVALSLDRLDMREDGRFCPHPATWLNGKRWLDGMDPEPDAQPSLIPQH